MRRPVCMVCLVFAMVVALCLYIRPLPSFDADKWDNTTVYLSGVVERIEYQNDTEKLYLKHVKEISFQRELASELSELSNVSCICYIEKADVRIGSVVTLTGTLRAFAQATNPGEFDYRAYCAVQEIYFSVENAEILERSASYDVIRDALFRIREEGVRILEANLGSKDAGVLAAMLLGERSGLTDADRWLFQQGGISHVLAISGLHISLIGMGIYRILEKMRLPYFVCMTGVICLMVLYGMMTGMSNSAYRAILMFVIKLNARRVGRTYDMLTALAISAVWILIENPRYVFHAGFQLSFGAIIGLGCVAPALENVFGKTDKKGWIHKLKQSMYGSVSVTMVTLPVLLYHYFEYSVYSVVLNLVVLPTVGAVVGSGVLLWLCGSVWRPGGQIFAAICAFILGGYRIGCAILNGLPGAMQIIGRPRGHQIWCYVIGILLLLGLSAHKVYREQREEVGKKHGRKYAGAGVLIVFVAVCCLVVPARSGVRITFLDVGQGDCACIQIHNGHGILIDSGSTSKGNVTEYQLVPFLKSQGIHTLDTVFLSHLDEDHISGVRGLLESGNSGIRIGQIVLSAYAPRDESWEEFVIAAERAGVPVGYIKQGVRYGNEELGITCLYPAEQGINGERNAQSMVLLLEYGDFRALFTGDIDAAGERELLDALPDYFSCDVLKVAHHGSRYSSTEEFLERIQPELAVISCAENSSYGHPHEETLERLREVGSVILTTPEAGAVMVEIRDDMKVRIFKYR